MLPGEREVFAVPKLYKAPEARMEELIEEEQSPGQRNGVDWARCTREHLRRSFEVDEEGGTFEIIRPAAELISEADTLASQTNVTNCLHTVSKGKHTNSRNLETSDPEDPIVENLREILLPQQAQDALRKLRGGAPSNKSLSIQDRLELALRSTMGKIREDEALLSLVLRIMAKEEQLSLSKERPAFRTKITNTSSKREKNSKYHEANLSHSTHAKSQAKESPRRTQLILAEDTFEAIYLDMMRHMNDFDANQTKSATFINGQTDRKALVSVLREVLLDTEIVASIKQRFMDVRAKSVAR